MIFIVIVFFVLIKICKKQHKVWWLRTRPHKNHTFIKWQSVTGWITQQHKHFITYVGYAEMSRALHNKTTDTYRLLELTQSGANFVTQIQRTCTKAKMVTLIRL